MKILIVGSLNSHKGQFAPFITEQAEAMRQCMVYGVQCTVEYFGIKGKGIKGYLRNIKELRGTIEEVRPDIIHAHYGLCGLLSCLAVKSIIPSFHQSIIQPKVVTTYHGSDINVPSVMRFSKIAMRLSACNIFVSQRTMQLAISNKQSSIARKSALIPCGINMPPDETDPRITNALLFHPCVLEPGKKHVLFAGAFDNAVKDPKLAKLAAAEVRGMNEEPIQLVELKGYTRDQVTALMYKCDAFLMTSKSEGSPQVIKEAMACGLPIVSTDVGDVKERLTINQQSAISNQQLLPGCYVAESREPKEIAELLEKALRFGRRTEGRRRIEEMGLRNEEVAQKLVEIYKSVSCRG